MPQRTGRYTISMENDIVQSKNQNSESSVVQSNQEIDKIILNNQDNDNSYDDSYDFLQNIKKIQLLVKLYVYIIIIF